MSPTRVKSLLVCLLSFFWLSKGAVGQQQYTIQSVTLSRTSIVTDSSQTDNIVVTATIQPPAAPNTTVGVHGSYVVTTCGFSGISISNGQSSGTATLTGFHAIGAEIDDTVVATLGGCSSNCQTYSVAIKLLPNTPTITVSSPVTGGQQTTGTVNFVAPGPTNSGLTATISDNLGLASGTCHVASGFVSGSCLMGSQFPLSASLGFQFLLLAATQTNGAAAHYERVTPKHINVHEGIPLSTISRTTCPTVRDVTQCWREQWRF
jgi:hypothetical protein